MQDQQLGSLERQVATLAPADGVAASRSGRKTPTESRSRSPARRVTPGGTGGLSDSNTHGAMESGATSVMEKEYRSIIEQLQNEVRFAKHVYMVYTHLRVYILTYSRCACNAESERNISSMLISCSYLHID